MAKSILIIATLLALTFLCMISTLPSVAPIQSDQGRMETDGATEISYPLPTLVDATLTSGLIYSHVQASDQIQDIKDSHAASACPADFDNDGWQDLVMIAGQGSTRFFGRKSWWTPHRSVVIYRNTGGQFQAVAEEVSASIEGSTMGCLTGDFDNDGKTDLLVLTDGHDHLFRNIGKFKFEAVPSFRNITQKAWSTHAAAADVNHDGLIDLYITHYLAYEKNINRFESSTGFSEQHQSNFNPESFDGMHNQLLINQGDFSFVDETVKWGLGNHKERTLSAYWNLEQDDHLGLYLFNDRGHPFRFFKQRADGIFQERIAPVSTDGSRFGLIGAGLPDSPSNLTKPTGNRLLYIARPQGSSSMALPLYQKAYTRTDTQTDQAWPLGYNRNELIYLDRWGFVLSDLNNDGYNSIVQANGVTAPDNYAGQLSLAQPNGCFHLNSQTMAYDYQPCTMADIPQSTRSTVSLDINNDGLQDILYLNNNSFPQLLLNESTEYGNWLNLEISVAKWWGGTLTVTGSNKEHSRRITYNPALFGNSDPRFHFGLATDESVTVKLYDRQHNLVLESQMDTNGFYRFEGNQWNAIQYAAPKTELAGLPDADIATLLRLIGNQSMRHEDLQFLLVRIDHLEETEIDALAQFIDDIHSPHLIPLYAQLLHHPSTRLSIAAIRALGDLEDERTLPAMLQMLNSADTERLCTAASQLYLWFREEEAVIRSKWRAIPVLMRLLDASDSHTVTCAAFALSEADHPTPALALMQRLENAPQAAKPTIIRSLGLLRHTRAAPQISEILLYNNHPEVVAEAVIALTRLNDSELDITMSRRLSEPSLAEANQAALNLLSQHPENTVIKPHKLSQWSQHLFQEGYPQPVAHGDIPPSIHWTLLMATVAREKAPGMADEKPGACTDSLNRSQNLQADEATNLACQVLRNISHKSLGQLKMEVGDFSTLNDADRLTVVRVLANQSQLTTRNRQKISIALLTHSTLPVAIKQAWSLEVFKNDDYASQWLISQLQQPRGDVITEWLKRDGYKYLSLHLDPLTLIGNTSMDRDTRIQLASYYTFSNQLKGTDFLKAQGLL